MSVHHLLQVSLSDSLQGPVFACRAETFSRVILAITEQCYNIYSYYYRTLSIIPATFRPLKILTFYWFTIILKALAFCILL